MILLAAMTGITYVMVSLMQTMKISEGRFIAVKGSDQVRA